MMANTATCGGEISQRSADMGFSKARYRNEFQVVVTVPMNPGDTYTFTFPKKLPQAALDAEKAFLSLGDTATPDDWRKSLIGLVAKMVLKAPQGFEDFPEDGPLDERVCAYFDDTEKPELEAIIIKAWKEYKAAAVPAAYIKSIEVRGAAGGDASGASADTASVV
jgi:hypothetical protein